MVHKVRRSYAAPAGQRLPLAPFGGMSDRPVGLPGVAARCENLYRVGQGEMAKRTGILPCEERQLPGRVLWDKHCGQYRYICYQAAEGYTLRRRSEQAYADRPLEGKPTAVAMGEDLLILSDGLWLYATAAGKLTGLSAEGELDLTDRFTATAGAAWKFGGGSVPIPLVSAGASPRGAGRAVQPPNLLTPLQQESFLYTAQDRQEHRNRFCLTEQPALHGALPTDENGSHLNIPEADRAIRERTLNASAELEVRIRYTDAYGNETYAWEVRPWLYADNISGEDAAFWVQDVHTLALAEDGDDNLRITYYSRARMAQNELQQAGSGTMFGVGGRQDRLFVAVGDRLYYSEMDKPFCFGAGHSFCPDHTDIRLLDGRDNLLTVMTALGCYRVTGSAGGVEGEYVSDASFAVSARLPAPLPLSGQTVVAGGELLYLSVDGLSAVTPSGVLDERKIAVRSGRVRELLSDRDGMTLHTFRNWVLVGCSAGVLLFDTDRSVKTDEGRGFECWLWPDIHPDCFVEGEPLSFYIDGLRYRLKDGSDTRPYYDERIADNARSITPVQALWRSHPLLQEDGKCHRIYALTLCVQPPTAGMLRVERANYDFYGIFSRFGYVDFDYGSLAYRSDALSVGRFALPFLHRRNITVGLESDTGCAFQVKDCLTEYK